MPQDLINETIIMDVDGDLWRPADDGSWFCPTAMLDGCPAFAPDLDHLAEWYGPLHVYRAS